MPRFKRLTDAEARTLTRAELLDRAEAELAYWARRRPKTEEDRAARREFGRIMHKYLNPVEAIDELLAALNYWQTRPGR